MALNLEYSVKNRPKAAKNTALERLSFTQEKRKGQRFSYLFEPPKGGMADNMLKNVGAFFGRYSYERIVEKRFLF